MAGLSRGADRAWRAGLAAALAVGVVAGGAQLVAGGLFDSDDPRDTTSETTGDTSTTDVPLFDVDDDGRFDYGILNDEVVAVPAAPPGDGDDEDEWLVFTGTVVAALIGAGGLVGVARLNRDSEDEIAELKRRIDSLESG
jgi:hypothetical protein